MEKQVDLLCTEWESFNLLKQSTESMKRLVFRVMRKIQRAEAELCEAFLPTDSAEEPHQGLKLVETFVVIAIIGIIMSLIMVGVQSARESARRITYQNNLHQVGIGIVRLASFIN